MTFDPANFRLLHVHVCTVHACTCTSVCVHLVSMSSAVEAFPKYIPVPLCTLCMYMYIRGMYIYIYVTGSAKTDHLVKYVH